MNYIKDYIIGLTILLFVSSINCCRGDSVANGVISDTGQVILSARIVNEPKFYRNQGDLWMSTWADDGNLYLSWGDGSARGDCCASDGPVTPQEDCNPVDSSVRPGQLLPHLYSECTALNYCSCRFTDAGIGVFEGSPMDDSDSQEDFIISLHVPTHKAPFDANSNPLDRDDKPSSLLFVEGTLYWAGHTWFLNPNFGYIAYSENYGETWTEVPNSPWQSPSPFLVLMFINMGKNYGLNKDGYVYALGMGAEAGWKGRIYLTRVLKEQIKNYDAYDYFTEIDSKGNPIWSSDPSKAQPLEGLQSAFQGSAMYHEGTERYLFLTTHHRPDQQEEEIGALFVAPNPWGPWSKVADLFKENDYPPGWLPWGYIPGVIAKDAGTDYFYFTISFFTDFTDHYQLTMGKIQLGLRK